MPTESSASYPPAITYASTGVNYSDADPIKRLAQELSRLTSGNISRHPGFAIVEASRGESAFVWEEPDSYRAFVVEGLGTKSLVADAWFGLTGISLDSNVAQDTIAMIVNDLITVGADPLVVNAYFAAGDSKWFANQTRMEQLIHGWAESCNQSGAVWGGGESPMLKGIILENAADLAGAAVGIVKPKDRLTLGDSLVAGDSILMALSSGIHANGLSLARRVKEELPKGYETLLPDGKAFGESLLTPTQLYPKFVRELFDEGLDIHYMVNVTGHGWRKLMRAVQPFSYIIDQIPEPQPIFHFLQEHTKLDNAEMYATFNMGAGYAVIMPHDQTAIAHEIAQVNNLASLTVGYLEDGPKQVVIRPKEITFPANSLQVR